MENTPPPPYSKNSKDETNTKVPPPYTRTETAVNIGTVMEQERPAVQHRDSSRVEECNLCVHHLKKCCSNYFSYSVCFAFLMILFFVALIIKWGCEVGFFKHDWIPGIRNITGISLLLLIGFIFVCCPCCLFGWVVYDRMVLSRLPASRIQDFHNSNAARSNRPIRRMSSMMSRRLSAISYDFNWQ